MANKHSSLTALFTDIANAIREKTGGTATIIADDFPDAIRERLQVIPTIPYLTFSSPSSFTLKVNDATKHWDGTLEYFSSDKTWTAWDGITTLSSVYNDGDNAIYLEERLADNKKGSIDNDTMIGLYKALNKINDREKNILLERYVIGKTQTEIAGTLNISQAQVSRIEKCALSKVRRLIK